LEYDYITNSCEVDIMMEMQKAAVAKYRDLIIKTQEYIWANPETGYREVKTSKYMEDVFESLGYEIVRAGDIPGFYTVIDTGRPGPEVLVMGELDSLICHEHPDADPVTGAVHCCGHSAQCAALVGVAAALKEPGILDGLSGRIRLCAVPAEELIEIEYRSELIEKGIIHYLGGKTEFLYRGYFDDCDIAFMVHTTQGKGFAAKRGSVGIVAKRVLYKGVSSHAGGSPWDGNNALYAATQGLSAINAIRETFKENDIIRVHPIITKGGGAVNAIPDSVIIESYVRGRTFEAISEANRRVNRALCGAALSLGCNIDIQDKPGYAPLWNCDPMVELARDAAEAFPDIPFDFMDTIGSGSTDMGEISCVMPAIHPYAPGAIGKSHGADYYIENADMACVASAQWQVIMLTLLLKDGAVRAKQVLESWKPPFKSSKEYFACVDKLNRSGDRIEYTENGAIVHLDGKTGETADTPIL